MGSSIFKIFQIFGIVSSWAAQALDDGKITLKEATNLAGQIAEVLGVAIEIEVPGGDMGFQPDEEFTSGEHPARPPPKPPANR